MDHFTQRFPALNVPRWARETALAAALLMGYSLLLVALIPHMGLSARGFTMLVVAAGAWRWGIPGGVATWLATVVINSWAAYLALDTVGYGLNVAPYIISTLALGVLVGRFRGIGQRLKSELAEREHMQAILRDSEEGYRLLFQDNPLPMWVMDIASLRYLATNEAASRHYGYSAQEFAAMTATDVVPEEDRRDLLARLSAPLPRMVQGVRLRHRKKDGTVIDVEVTAHDVQFQGKQARLVLANDVTERARVEERLHFQATHDALTGLPNRTLLQEHLEQTLALARRGNRQLALLLVDLDRFKEINDTLGHHFGDLVLQQISGRFRPALRDSDILARLGGDEFAIILPETDEHGALQVCERLLESLVEPFEFKEQSFDVGASIGIAIFPVHGEDATTLLRLADVAMYLAKRSASGFAVYSSQKNQYTPRRLALVAELRQGIENDQLLLHYQPKLDLHTMRVRSAEALVRWQHPRDGLMNAAQFVPLAQHAGLIKPLSLWVLNSALMQCRVWRQAGLCLDVSINLPACSLHDPMLVEKISRHLASTDASPSWLTIEVTESAVVTEAAVAGDVLRELHDMGVKISIDDFGTGQSSLAYFKHLPVDEVKLDRVFIKDLTTDKNAEAIVRSVTEMSHSMDIKVVAVGIEDQATLEYLLAGDCDLAQGFHLCRPLPPAEFTTWLGRANARLAIA